MKKVTLSSVLSVVLVLLAAGLAMAQEGGEMSSGPSIVHALISIAAAVSVGVAALGCGIGMGTGIGGACSGIARNPEASGKIQVNMIIGLALIESLTIYGLVISLILLYANPLIG